ncbi:phospholipase C/P1 nuclease domain-containing protein [Kalaharituber pfeilii]|nr:phospholipase C/P1 nuclease domain-containing protein [Kalaharituber pfeilii]
MRRPTRKTLLPVLLLLPSPSLVYAWGQLPHRAIAILSTRYFLPETAAFIRRVLPSYEPIGNAAIWPDYFSHTPEGRWSGPLHYIDAHDDPEGGVCGVDLERDCGSREGKEEGWCVVGGVVNATLQLLNPDLTPVPQPTADPSKPSRRPSHRRPHRPPRRGRPHHLEIEADLDPTFARALDFADLLELDLDDPSSDDSLLFHSALSSPPHWSTPAHLALRFLIHFIADLHQPLHTEALLRGGNSLPVLFNGAESNLHSVWDSLIPQALVGGRTPRDAIRWADELHKNISSFSPEELRSWAGSCFLDIEKVSLDAGGKVPRWKVRECALEWARWSNGYVCSYVFKGVENYTEGARVVVDELVGMAGWRLGGWMNLVVTGRLGLDIGEDAEVVKEEAQEQRGAWRERVERVGQKVLGAAVEDFVH